MQKLRAWERRSERHLSKKQLICFISLKWLMLWWFIFTMACPALQWSWYVGVFNTINLIRTSSVINRLDWRCVPLLSRPLEPICLPICSQRHRERCSSCSTAPGGGKQSWETQYANRFGSLKDFKEKKIWPSLAKGCCSVKFTFKCGMSTAFIKHAKNVYFLVSDSLNNTEN